MLRWKLTLAILRVSDIWIKLIDVEYRYLSEHMRFLSEGKTVEVFED